MPQPLILFVCTGNICRSPMAEYLFRHRLGPRSATRVASAGVSAMPGFPASVPAVAVLAEQGIDLTPHRSRPLLAEAVDDAKLIVVMTASHRDYVRAVHPDAAEKLFLLKSFGASDTAGDIPDPIGMSTPVYREVRDDIDACLPGLTDFLSSLE